jgi:hypothetical protein
MEPVVGMFPSRASAEGAAGALRALGFSEHRVSMLLPGDSVSPAELENEVPTEEAEQSGTGPAVGGVMGAAAGATAGFGAGALVASLLVPGVGAVTAVGLAAAALFGAAGAVGGARAGEALEHTRHGIPKDELYLYEDALSHGYGVVFVEPRTDAEADAARKALVDAGAQSLEAARDTWWVGIRDAERAHFDASEDDFESAEQIYRQGLLAALRPDSRGRKYDEARADLRQRFGTVAEHSAFRQGYTRGLERAREREGALVEKA